MALDRLLPISTTPGAVTGDSYMDAVQEEVTGLWDRSTITLTAVAGTNTITATGTPALTASLVNGMNFILKPAATNTSTVTLNINGGGAIAVVDSENVALVAGALRIGAHYLLNYDSTLTKFVIVGYTPAATTSPGLVMIKSQLAAAVAQIDFVNGVSGVVMDDTYDAYHLVCSNVKPATDDVEAWLRVGTGGGPTYQTATYGYAIRAIRSTDGASMDSSSAGASAAAKIVLGPAPTGTLAVGNAAGERFDCTIDFADPEVTTSYSAFQFRGSYNQAVDGDICAFNGAGEYHVAGAITGIRFMFESGNITSGRFSLYGRTKV